MQIRPSRMDWDSLRFLLALARAGSVKEAARSLGVDTSTVTRRIAALEGTHGRLFERSGPNWTCTPRGEEIRATAERVDREMDALERRLRGLDATRSRVRVSCPTVLAAAVADVLRGLAEERPDIALEFEASDARVDLAHGQADVVVRIEESPAPNFVGRRVGRLAVSVFAAPSYRDQKPGDVEHPDHDWVAWDTSYADKVSMRYENERFPSRRVAARGATGEAVFQAVRAGLGLGLLPTVVGNSAGFVALLELPPEACPTVWVLSAGERRENDAVTLVRTRLFDLSKTLGDVRAVH